MPSTDASPRRALLKRAIGFLPAALRALRDKAFPSQGEFPSERPSPLRGKAYEPLKRRLDIALSLGGIAALSPLITTITITIRLESDGPALFRQKRLGLNGEGFEFLKFRSMCADAEKDGVYSGEGDPRVTRVGRFIRATSLDELPQLFNVLRGDMSLIGPRPVLTYHPWAFDAYSPEQRRRFEVRPGLTGWAQIHGRRNVEWSRRLAYDAWYVEHLSLRLDAEIFLKTLGQVLLSKNNLNVGETAS